MMSLSNRSKSPQGSTNGFTLVELLVVIVVIGILAAIAVPVFLNQAEKANLASAQSDAANIAKLVQADYAETGTISAISGQTYTSGNGFGSVVATGTVSISGDASTWCVESDVDGAVASYSAENGAGTGCTATVPAIDLSALSYSDFFLMYVGGEPIANTWSAGTPILGIDTNDNAAYVYLSETAWTNYLSFTSSITPVNNPDGSVYIQEPNGRDYTWTKYTSDPTLGGASIVSLY